MHLVVQYLMWALSAALKEENPDCKEVVIRIYLNGPSPTTHTQYIPKEDPAPKGRKKRS